MKIFVEFSVELINLALTALQGDVLEVILNYIALASISELDEMYYNSIKSPLKDQMEDKDFELPIVNAN